MKDIPGFEGRYAITEEGRIWSYPNRRNVFQGMWLKPYKAKTTNKRKRPRYFWNVSLFDSNGRRYVRQVHRLVALTFLPNPENKPIVNHKDGNSLNPRKDNLEWVTSKENSDHAFAKHLVNKPLQEGEVRELRKIAGFYPLRHISLAYGFNPGFAWDVINGRRYAGGGPT